MEFSTFGQKFTRQAGITLLMDDLNQGLQDPDAIMLGGGNPAAIPELQQALQQEMQACLARGELLQTVANYDGPLGKDAFAHALAELLQREYGWPVTANNIALTNGSQTAFFYLFNLLAGDFPNGRQKKVLFPLAPEYIGYADSALSEDMFVACKPSIHLLEDRLFKYQVDFEALQIDEDIGLICVSRPTNPTGNVLTDEEIAKLDQLAREHDIPLLIDGAYGPPFPNIIFSKATPCWNNNIILSLSLSKLGLPGCRCGIVVANEKIIQAMGNLSGIINLTPGGLGPTLMQRWVESGDIIRHSAQWIRPFYQAKAQQTVRWLLEAIPDPSFRIHKPEGALFLWLWFDGLPIHSQALYQRLKEVGVIVVPGHYFFPGIEDAQWPHQYQCLRLNYAQPEPQLRQAIYKLADLIQELYQQ